MQKRNNFNRGTLYYRIKDKIRDKKFAKERGLKGFARCDLWDLAVYYCNIFEKSLLEFKTITNGTPHDFYKKGFDEYYEKHSEEIGISKREFVNYNPNKYADCKEKMLELSRHHNEAEEYGFSLWLNEIQSTALHFHNANPDNQFEIMEANNWNDDVDGYKLYKEFANSELKLGFKMLQNHFNEFYT